MNNLLYVVIPCYNEEEVLDETIKRLKEKFNYLIKNKLISKNSKIMFVDDGSKDKTWEIINRVHNKEKYFTGLKLSRNCGHQRALLAGLMNTRDKADVIISMDADLQDDIDAIDEMIRKYNDGNEIVYGVRSSRNKDSFFKKFTAEFFYKFMKKLGVDCIYNHADYRLTSKRVLNELAGFKERNLFLRGIFPLVGFKYDIVYYERNERFAGESKYPLKKMVNFALDGITSFSIKPLRFIFWIGFLIIFISFLILLYFLVKLLLGFKISINIFILMSIWFVGGLVMLSIGVIGEYLGKIYYEVKERPRYIIDIDLDNN